MNPNPIKMESIVKNEFIFYLNVIFGIITANGKSICEERATLWAISKENRFKQNAFSDF